MNFKIYLLILGIFLLGISSCKKNIDTEAELVKCCGTFLHLNGEYLTVCNENDFIDVPSGSVLRLTYRFVNEDDCDAMHNAHCMMVCFPYSGKRIEIREWKVVR